MQPLRTINRVCDRNAESVLPTGEFRLPQELHVRQSNTVANDTNTNQALISRAPVVAPTDLRRIYLSRLMDYRRKLNGPHNRVSLEVMLDNVNRCYTQLMKLIEMVEIDRVMTQEELEESTLLYEQAIEYHTTITIEARTRLELLDPAVRNQNAAQLNVDNRHLEHVRRIDAKVTPFDGRSDRDLRPTFKAKFEHYYHKCQRSWINSLRWTSLSCHNPKHTSSSLRLIVVCPVHIRMRGVNCAPSTTIHDAKSTAS